MAHCRGPVELCVCMRDVLLQLASTRYVKTLLRNVAAILEPGGRFVLTFRDLTWELQATERFIPVKSSEQLIVTRFLEYKRSSVTVHDLVHRRTPEGWSLQKNCYDKLRISRDWIVRQLIDAGLTPEFSRKKSGIVTLIARR